MTTKILILGANGFIGSHLVESILSNTDFEVVGVDKGYHNIKSLMNHSRFTLIKKNLDVSDNLLCELVNQSDIVLPLVALPRPYEYINSPINVFDLTFQLNLHIIQLCMKYRKRIIFPSSSEVYGLCPDRVLSENQSFMVTGPVHHTRWIYSCSKQLLERVLHCYGIERGLQFTIFRPFNWFGPRLDQDNTISRSRGRVVSNFIKRALHDESLQVVNGGDQMRCFTYISDGISCLMKIIIDPNNICKQRVFNIGNPDNNLSIRELANIILQILSNFRDVKSQIETIDSEKFYGDGYTDIERRIPNIEMASDLLNWKPAIGINEALKKTIRYYMTS